MHIHPSRLRAGAFIAAMLGTLVAGAATPAFAADIATLASPGPEGASVDPGTGTASTDPAQAMLDFTKCMRDHGIDMPDPQMSTDGGGMVVMGGTFDSSDDEDGADGGPTLSGPDFNDPEFQAANEACAALLEASMPQIDPEQQAEMEAQALAFAQCMRDHGVDMPDPQFGTGPGGAGMTIQIGGPAGDGEDDGPRLDPRSDEFQAAQEACGSAFGFGPGASAQEQTAPDASVAP